MISANCSVGPIPAAKATTHLTASLGDPVEDQRFGGPRENSAHFLLRPDKRRQPVPQLASWFEVRNFEDSDAPSRDEAQQINFNITTSSYPCIRTCLCSPIPVILPTLGFSSQVPLCSLPTVAVSSAGSRCATSTLESISPFQKRAKMMPSLPNAAVVRLDCQLLNQPIHNACNYECVSNRTLSMVIPGRVVGKDPGWTIR